MQSTLEVGLITRDCGSMKRAHESSLHDDLGRAWAGVNTSQPLSTAKTPANGTLQVAKSCELCGVQIDGTPDACENCDAGPFHTLCLADHSCSGDAMGGRIAYKGPSVPVSNPPLGMERGTIFFINP